jgi:hypothetical protein
VQQRDAVKLQELLVVPVLVAQVDDGADPVLAGEPRHVLGQEAAADGELARDPMEVRMPSSHALDSL